MANLKDSPKFNVHDDYYTPGTGGGAGGGSMGLVARAIVGCWNTLAWSISGATLHPLVVGALQETLGWPLQHAKAFAIMHAANLAAAVPDSPEYVSALSAVGVVGFLSMHPTATLARYSVRVMGWHFSPRYFAGKTRFN